MERFYKKVSPIVKASSSSGTQSIPVESTTSPKTHNIQVDLENLPSDPGLRPNIMSYPPNMIEQVRRAYLLKGPCQPHEHDFPQKEHGSKKKRKFVASWFYEFSDWLEYSIAKDAAFCLYCYLFSSGRSERGHDAFVCEGFSNWSKKRSLREHAGDHNSDHSTCRSACRDLMNQAQHIEVVFSNISEQSKFDYRCRLNASILSLRYLLAQAMPFRGHDESSDSPNQGNFIELLKVFASINEEIKRVTLNNAPGNHMLTSPSIQKDIINAAATETTRTIVKDIGDNFFSILVDECRDVSIKEQMGVVVRYVNNIGCVIERFLGIVHVSDTSALSLEKAIDSLFSDHGLSISSLRGQRYDGASNMRGEFRGLKSLLLKRNCSAYYVHCFSHQLQLTIVVVAHKHTIVGSFCNKVTRLCNIVGVSCKRRDMLREKQMEKIIEGIATDEIKTGRGLNQEKAMKRPGDTHWSSHYGTFINLIHLFPSIVEVLEFVGENASEELKKAEAIDVLDIVIRFEFVFVLHLMRHILGITHELSQVLQRKDQDIVNAMNLVRVSKMRLQAMRDDDWETLLTKVSEFCSKHEILVLKMDDEYAPRGRIRRGVEKITNLHYYRVELFYSVIDMQIQELNYRFDEVNTKLLLCMACFDPKDSFSAFDQKKLLELAKFYPCEFSKVSLYELESQLDNFIYDVRLDANFSEVLGIGDLAQKMVATKKHQIFPLVFLLLKLSLTLPVATALVERAFSALNLIKTSLRNRMGDELLNDCLVTYIERDIFTKVSNEAIMQRFQKMKNRREML